jgi:hypothetical protein
MRHFGHILAVTLALSASVSLAQSASEPPRFGGTSSGASSQRAETPGDLQNGINAAQAALVRRMVEEAALEAAREEGTRFIEARRDRQTHIGQTAPGD